MAEAITPEDAANLLTFVAPGVAARVGYNSVYPGPDTGQLRGLVVVVATSLPLVALLHPLAKEVGVNSDDPLNLGYLAILLGGSLVLGYVWALIRGTPPVCRAIGWITNPGLAAYRSSEPDSTVLARVMNNLPDQTGVTIGLSDGRELRGGAYLWSNPLDAQQAVYLNYHQWRDKSSGAWGEKSEKGGVVVHFDEITFFEVNQTPAGLEARG